METKWILIIIGIILSIFTLQTITNYFLMRYLLGDLINEFIVKTGIKNKLRLVSFRKKAPSKNAKKKKEEKVDGKIAVYKSQFKS